MTASAVNFAMYCLVQARCVASVLALTSPLRGLGSEALLGMTVSPCASIHPGKGTEEFRGLEMRRLCRGAVPALDHPL